MPAPALLGNKRYHHTFPSLKSYFLELIDPANRVVRLQDHPEYDAPCILWQRSLEDGYGRFLFKGRLYLAHRVYHYLIHQGMDEVPKSKSGTGDYVCHLAHHVTLRHCLNHCYLGDTKTNMADLFLRDRTRRGIANHDPSRLIAEYQAGASIKSLERRSRELLGEHFSRTAIQRHLVRLGVYKDR